MEGISRSRGVATLNPALRAAGRNAASRLPQCKELALPDARERAAIRDIVIAKYGRKPIDFGAAPLTRACE